MKTRMLRLAVFMLVGMLLANVDAAERTIIKISVLASGEFLVDGKPSDPQQLQAALQQLRAVNGAVWYYRENGQEEASPQAMKVIEMIIDSQVPVSMSSQPDFSDYIDAQGLSHPRQE